MTLTARDFENMDSSAKKGDDFPKRQMLWAVSRTNLPANQGLLSETQEPKFEIRIL
jgi:hypothetical protein